MAFQFFKNFFNTQNVKVCIWCCRGKPYVTFDKLAHTIPQSLGGINICENVCDSCNIYFGSKTNLGPSIEIAFKEVLNVSKLILLKLTDSSYRFKSEYFKIDSNLNIHPKLKYSQLPLFQEKLGRQIRQGFFKVFLEERERQRKDAKDKRYNFIREFSRFDLGDIPVFWFKPKFQAIIFSQPDTMAPTIRFTKHSNKMDRKYKFFEYQIAGHYFALPTSQLSQLQIEKYKNHIKQIDHPFGTELIEIKKFEDIDFSFSFFNDSP